MKSSKNFTVTNPPITFWLCILILGLFVILVLINTIFSPPPHIAMYVCITIFIFIPGTIVALWTKMFRIKVSGTEISVRKCLGLGRFNFDVSEIDSVEWKIVETKFGQNEKIKVFTSKGKKISIETLMINSDKFIKYLEENVNENRINKIYN